MAKRCNKLNVFPKNIQYMGCKYWVSRIKFEWVLKRSKDIEFIPPCQLLFCKGKGHVFLCSLVDGACNSKHFQKTLAYTHTLVKLQNKK